MKRFRCGLKIDRPYLQSINEIFHKGGLSNFG